MPAVRRIGKVLEINRLESEEKENLYQRELATSRISPRDDDISTGGDVVGGEPYSGAFKPGV